MTGGKEEKKSVGSERGKRKGKGERKGGKKRTRLSEGEEECE